MDFERIEKQVFEVAAFLDGLIKEIPKVDFIKDYDILKNEIVKKENYNYGNFKKFYQFVEACSTFSVAFETKKVEIKYELYDWEQLELFMTQFNFFRDYDSKINDFINSHFPEIIDDSELPSNLRYLKEIIYSDEETKKLEPEIIEQTLTNPKLRWKGTPAQFGYFIIELIGKGYLQKPTGSFNKDAIKYLNIFDIQGPNGPTTPATIAKEINDQQNSLSTENGRLLNLPRIEQLK